MNKKGFTLAELIATITILGIIMIIAIPNVLSIIEKNKQEDFIETAKRLITEAEYKVRSDSSIELPTEDNHGIILTLNYLDSGNFDQSSYEYPYDMLSFVLVVKESSTYKYYVHLTASEAYSINTVTTFSDSVLNNSKNRGINLATYEQLNGDDRFELVQKAAEVELELFSDANEDMNITVGDVVITIDNILI